MLTYKQEGTHHTTTTNADMHGEIKKIIDVIPQRFNLCIKIM